MLDAVNIAIKSPTVPLSVLRRLGQPSFVDEDLERLLGPKLWGYLPCGARDGRGRRRGGTVRLEEQLWKYTVEDLKRLIRLLGGPGPKGTRKEFLVKYIFERLTQPDSLEEMWQQLDTLSQKAVAAAYTTVVI